MVHSWSLIDVHFYFPTLHEVARRHPRLLGLASFKTGPSPPPCLIPATFAPLLVSESQASPHLHPRFFHLYSPLGPPRAFVYNPLTEGCSEMAVTACPTSELSWNQTPDHLNPRPAFLPLYQTEVQSREVVVVHYQGCSLLHVQDPGSNNADLPTLELRHRQQDTSNYQLPSTVKELGVLLSSLQT